jgi:hypothetical protein
MFSISLLIIFVNRRKFSRVSRTINGWRLIDAFFGKSSSSREA